MVISHCGPSTATTVSEPVLIFRRQLRKRSKIRIVCVPHTGDHTFKVIAPKLWSSLYRAVFPCMFPIIFGHICMRVHACACVGVNVWLHDWLCVCMFEQRVPFIWTMKHFVTVCFENCYINEVIPAVIISISTRVINTLQHPPVFIDQSEPKKSKINKVWRMKYGTIIIVEICKCSVNLFIL